MEKHPRDLVLSPNGYLVFDDTVLEKRHSFKIACVKSQWSGNEHKVIKGIGVVTCVYVNPDTEQFWAIDYRLYNPEADGKSKLSTSDMLDEAIEQKKLPFKTVLMDSWYAKRKLILYISDFCQKIYYAPIDSNRLIADIVVSTLISEWICWIGQKKSWNRVSGHSKFSGKNR